MHVQSCCFTFINLLFFAVLVAVAVVVVLAPFCCDSKVCYHGNVTLHFASLFFSNL